MRVALVVSRRRSTSMEQIQILIADDHPVFRDGLRVLLTSAAEMAAVGEATTGVETISMATTLQPDVILMDIRMPELNGIEATRQIVSNSPHIGILVLTMYEDDDSCSQPCGLEHAAICSKEPIGTKSWGPFARSTPGEPSLVQRSLSD
jgi:DNA-binding NarL/FixJ family response regulator